MTRAEGASPEDIESRLRDSEERLKLALRAGDLGIWDWNFVTGELVVNPRWMTQLGLDPDGPAPTIESWSARVHPEDVAVLQGIVERVFLQGQADEFACEIRARHEDGRWIWLLDQGLVARRDAEGRAQRITGTHLDITARKLGEQRARAQYELLRTVIDSTLDAIVTLAQDGTVLLFNPAAERMFGRRAEEVVGTRYNGFLPPPLRGSHDGMLRRFASQGRSTRVIVSSTPDTYALRADGSPFPIEASVARSGEGEDAVITAVIRDLTAARAAERAAQEKLRAEEANAAKSALVSQVSHELRTPLHAILGFAELLAHELAPGSTALSHARHIGTAGRRLLSLVNDLLDAQRLESGAVRLTLQPVDVDRAAQEAVVLLQTEARRRRQRLEVDARCETPALADPRALDQVLLNLVGNALKFTPPGGRVTLASQVADGDRLRITISDTGPGIPEHQRHLLFQPFARLDASAGVPGTGLGLSIVKQLVERMNGTVGFAPALPDGTGSTFTLTLPLAPREAPATGPSEPAAGERFVAGDPKPAASRRKVLVVEDDPLSALLIVELLGLAGGWEATVVERIEAAMAALEAGDFDAVLTDMHVAGRSAMELLRALERRGSGPAPFVVVVSAAASAAEIDQAMRAGAHGYWTKPLPLAATVRALQQAPQDWPTILRE